MEPTKSTEVKCTENHSSSLKRSSHTTPFHSTRGEVPAWQIRRRDIWGLFLESSRQLRADFRECPVPRVAKFRLSRSAGVTSGEFTLESSRQLRADFRECSAHVLRGSGGVDAPAGCPGIVSDAWRQPRADYRSGSTPCEARFRQDGQAGRGVRDCGCPKAALRADYRDVPSPGAQYPRLSPLRRETVRSRSQTLRSVEDRSLHRLVAARVLRQG